MAQRSAYTLDASAGGIALHTGVMLLWLVALVLGGLLARQGVVPALDAVDDFFPTTCHVEVRRVACGVWHVACGAWRVVCVFVVCVFVVCGVCVCGVARGVCGPALHFATRSSGSLACVCTRPMVAACVRACVCERTWVHWCTWMCCSVHAWKMRLGARQRE